MMVKRFVFMIVAFAAVGLLGAALSQQIIGINSAEELNKLPKKIEWKNKEIPAIPDNQIKALQPQAPTRPSSRILRAPLPLGDNLPGTQGRVARKMLHPDFNNNGTTFKKPVVNPGYVKGQLVVGFKQSARGKYSLTMDGKGLVKTGLKSIDALNQKNQVTDYRNVFTQLPPKAEEYGLDLMHVFILPEGTDMEATAAQYRGDPNVQFAHPDYIAYPAYVKSPFEGGTARGHYDPKGVTPTYPNDTYFDWAPNILQVPKARTVTGGDGTSGTADTIAILDVEQFNSAHTDMNNNFGFNRNSGDIGTASWHGNACAGHAAAEMNNAAGITSIGGGNNTTKGLIWICDLFTSASDNAAGIAWAVNSGACVISQSALYMGKPYLLEPAFANALANGVPAYISAGNDNNYSVNTWPAMFECVTAVGGIDYCGRHWAWDEDAGSNYGHWVDITAPGDAHWSCTATGFDGGYGGTSWATPEVAAIAGLCHHVTGKTGVDLKNTVMRTASSNYHLNDGILWAPQGTEMVGSGIANTYEAVMARDINASVDFISINSALNNYANYGDMYLQTYAGPTPDVKDTLFAYQAKRTLVPDVTLYPKAMVHNRGIAPTSFNVTAEATYGGGTYTSTKMVTLGSGKGGFVTFDGWTPTGTGACTLKVYSQLPGDENQVNDTVKVGFTKQLADTIYKDCGNYDFGWVDNWAYWAVKIYPERTGTLSRVNFFVNRYYIDGGAPQRKCSLAVWDANTTNGRPGNLIYKEEVPSNSIVSVGWKTRVLGTAQIISKPVFVSLKMFGGNGDTITLGMDYRKGSAETYYSADNGVSWDELGNDLAIRPLITYDDIQTTDAGVIEITEPSAPQLSKGMGYTPKAIIKNYGSNATGSFNVTCHVDSVGGTRVQKLNNTQSISLAPGEEREVSFAPFVPGGSTAEGPYNMDITVRTALGSDSRMGNDSIRTPLKPVASTATISYHGSVSTYFSDPSSFWIVRFTPAGPCSVIGMTAQIYDLNGTNAAETLYCWAGGGSEPGAVIGGPQAFTGPFYSAWANPNFTTPAYTAGEFYLGFWTPGDPNGPYALAGPGSSGRSWWGEGPTGPFGKLTAGYDLIIQARVKYLSSPNSDLGVVTLNAPTSVILKNFSVIPKATVDNPGKTKLNNPQVTCTITNLDGGATLHSNTQTIDSILPACTRALSFGVFTPAADSMLMKVKRVGTDDNPGNDSLVKKLYTSDLYEIDYSSGSSSLGYNKVAVYTPANDTMGTLAPDTAYRGWTPYGTTGGNYSFEWVPYNAVRFTPELPCSLVSMYEFLYRPDKNWGAGAKCSTFVWKQSNYTGYGSGIERNWPGTALYAQEHTPDFTGYSGGWLKTDFATPFYFDAGQDFWLGNWNQKGNWGYTSSDTGAAARNSWIRTITDGWIDCGRSFVTDRTRDSLYWWANQWADMNITALVKYLGGTSRTVNGLVTTVSTQDSLSFRTYLAKNLDQVLGSTLSGASIYRLANGQALWQFNAMHFWPRWNRGDTMLVVVDQETNSGTVGHAGYYAVMNDTLLIDVTSQTMNTSTLRQIPVPVASMEVSSVRISWPKPAYDAGKPSINPIIGYRVYRSTDGINYTALGSTGTYNDTTYLYNKPASGAACYAIKLRYFGSALSKGEPKAVVIESKFLSGNSNYVNPLAVSFGNMSAMVSHNDVTLKWRTESEENSYMWLVERSEDGGTNYAQIGSVPARGNSTVPTDYSYQDNNLTGGRIFFYRLGEQDLNGDITYYGPISVGPLAGRPAFYALGQAQPNPFSRAASISYQLREPGRVSIKVYSITGQLIRTLVDAHQEADYYQATWDGTNGRGQKVAAGIYLYRMDVNGFRDMKKALYIR